MGATLGALKDCCMAVAKVVHLAVTMVEMIFSRKGVETVSNLAVETVASLVALLVSIWVDGLAVLMAER